MQLIDGHLLFSPSDLTTYMDSPFASGMERLRLQDPNLADLIDAEDALLTSLQKKGAAHENEVDQGLSDAGYDVLEIKKAPKDVMQAATMTAMMRGQEIIIQGYLKSGDFAGYADYLVKVPGDSKLGDYHYEVWDSKLARSVKPYFIMQLCCYVEMLETIQGIRPKEIAVVLGDKSKRRFPVENYFGYYRSLKKSFLEFHDNFDGQFPDPAANQSFGRWSELAHNKLKEQDHLSQVANLTRNQIKNLNKAGILTMQTLAGTELTSISNMSDLVFARAKQQAQLQIQSRDKDIPVFQVLPHDPGEVRGLSMLPPHSPLDVFFDIEGYPAVDGGLEYLWGNTYFDEGGSRTFIDFWAHNAEEEKASFIAFIDWVYDRWLKDPDMHIYHYANYEIAAIRKLMGRYGVCEDKVDNLLRNKVFVDLFNVVRQGLLIGTPNYSIKSVELLYRGKRDTEVANGADSIIVYEEWRENPDGDTWQTSKILNSIRDYNIDDCDSTQELTAWLRQVQTENDIPFLLSAGGGEAEISEEVTKITLLRDKLLGQSQDLAASDLSKSKIMETLAWSLEFHRRENKPTWWRLFDRMGQTELELYDDMDCLVGLKRTAEPEKKTSTRKDALSIWRYRFDPNQPYRGQAKGFYVIGEEDMKVTAHDYSPDQGTIDLKRREPIPRHLNLVPDEYVNPQPIPDAIKYVVDEVVEDNFPLSAITDFLERRRPRIKGNLKGTILKGEKSLLEDTIEAAANLENSYLCIQGPPGAGKTYTAKHIIGELVKRGKRVGISSNSHKAIINLMQGAAQYCLGNNIECDFVKVGGSIDDPIFTLSNVRYERGVKNADLGQCTGGTAWTFCNGEVAGQYDFLFIDEAGQVSVANMIGMSQSTSNIIIMGDQMQLGQPIQGSHPGESGMSILEYLLEGHATIPPDLGVFLPNTYRMHPDVCGLISAQVYESRLKSDEGTYKHQVEVTGPIITKKSGVIFVPVEHEGNSQASDEEVEKILKIAVELFDCEYWHDEEGNKRRIGWDDILFVAPYNFQVNKLKAVLGPGARVGSVDKFQGQEAPIVIISMCASNAAESPRGIEFLFSKNRLNVALSRAQALAIVVGNPALANTPVTSPEQMELINFYCGVIDNGQP
ncbi:nuclease [Kordiimonas sediminis]|uniref:Nuclease n=1 Tax=Kordiimonas sediminis TaxID=1735581 RepID=A0A919AJ72_9PROT|nr:TM0106 family RecB-like putative nuclease [Kordiimonas sediminis]GHF12537.1 nuclease [Kordiimonas sediminis]